MRTELKGKVVETRTPVGRLLATRVSSQTRVVTEQEGRSEMFSGYVWKAVPGLVWWP